MALALHSGTERLYWGNSDLQHTSSWILGGAAQIELSTRSTWPELLGNVLSVLCLPSGGADGDIVVPGWPTVEWLEA